PKLKPAQKPKHPPYRKVSMKNNSTGTPSRSHAACTPLFDPCERVCEIDAQSLPQFVSPSHCLLSFRFLTSPVLPFQRVRLLRWLGFFLFTSPVYPSSW